MRITSVDALSPTELRAASLDGELQPLGNGFVALDLPVDARLRVLSLSSAVPDPRIIVSHRCAAWVWGWSPASCPTLCCSVSERHRVPSTIRRAMGVREVAIDVDEIVRIEGVALTTPLRTLIDLARHDDAPDTPTILTAALQRPRHEPRSRDFDESAIASALNRRPTAAHMRRARERLAHAQRSVTR